jgi:Mycothiol maleylpyruvate isomerase N-terminal domain
VSEAVGLDPRAALVATCERERAVWRDLVAEVGVDRMTEPGPMGPWSFKDLAAHLLGWRDRTIARLEAAADGREEPAPPWPSDLHDDDPINAWFQGRSDGRSVRAVLDDVDLSYERLAKALAALPEDLVTRRDALPWMEGESLAETNLFGHLHDEHMPSIRAWIATRT